MDNIFSSTAALAVDEPAEDTPLLNASLDQDLEGNNNEVTVTRRGVPLKKVLIPLLCLGFIGTVAATVGTAVGRGKSNSASDSSSEWAPLLQKIRPEIALKLKKIQELAPPRWRDHSKAPEDVCYTVECLDASLDILTAINSTVDPCADFYEFACGRWRAEHPLEGSQTRTGRFNKLRDEVNNITQEILTAPPEPSEIKPLTDVKNFYKQCIDLEALNARGTTPVTDVLNNLGGWPSLRSDWDATAFDLLNTVGTIRRVYLDSVLFRVYVSQDLKNTTRSVIYLDQPGFFLPRTVLLNQDVYATRIAAYKKYYVDVLTELSGAENPDFGTDADAIIAFETTLAQAAQPDETRGNVSRIYNPKKLDAYQTETDAVSPTNKLKWKSVLDTIFSSSTVDIANDEDIIVLELEYLEALVKALDDTDARIVANYLHWRAASGLLPETTDEMRNIQFEFDRVNSGITEPAKRETSCANAALNAWGMAIGSKYVEQAFDVAAKNNVDLMVDNLKGAFKGIIAELDWMSNATKVNAALKADAMRKFMAFPEWLENSTRLESEYAGLDIASNYLDSVTQLSQWMGDQGWKTLRQPTDKDDAWLSHPAIVNAFYSPEYNSITFPAGILQPPFYRIRGPESINYGGIGVVIGHEITHGFDDQGSQYDAEGNAQNWWTDADLAQFDQKAQCIVDQYGSYEPLPGKPINGDLTSGENIADNGGLRQAYRAYQAWVQENGPERRLPGLENMTSDQLFFLGYASLWCENSSEPALENQLNTDPHSPGRFRVIGPLQNSELFAQHFQCPVGSYMNPANYAKCVLW